MTDINLSSAQRILLKRAAEAEPDGLTIAPRARASAAILTGHHLLEGAGDMYRATPAGRRFLGLADVSVVDSVGARAPKEGTKAALVVALLGRTEGATIGQMSEATGWLPHSVRGFLAGALKRTHRLSATSHATDGGRIYRLTSGGAGDA